MIFFPVAILSFILLILALPFLFALGFLNILTTGFAQLGISPGITLFVLFLVLIGSSIDIPITKQKRVLTTKRSFFGLFSKPAYEIHCVAINLGGAIIPVLLSFYFLFQIYLSGFNLARVLIATLLMVIVTKYYSRIVPGKGITLPVFIPPLFSTLFAFFLMPNFAAPCAFVSGVLGTLIGADLLNLKKMRRLGGFLSIGGAGVFDGIFLIGIVSALLSG